MAEERVQRRLAAILAADVVGYSRLMERDEVGTLVALKSRRKEILQPLLAKHIGRIIKLMGDGVLVEFASAVNAVHCAVELQNAMEAANVDLPQGSRILLRVGINLGDVMVEGSDLYGDGVNIAARLEALADPGCIVVSRTVFDQVRGKVKLEFDDLGEQHLKNIGEPVRIFRLRLDGEAALARPALALPDKPSIAVLPFDNMSRDPDQEYFADGMVEEIVTALSRFQHLFVIARNSSFTYKGRSVDIKQVGRELGVRYVLEGSVRKAGDKLRISGQLVDAFTGMHLWADRFDGGMEDIFDLQDRVTENVVGAIAPEVERAEIKRAARKPTASLDAYDHYLRGVASLYQWTREGTSEALRIFYRATEIDPNFASAHGAAAWCYCLRKINSWMTDRTREIAEATRLAWRATELGRDNATALSASGIALVYVAGDLDNGVALIDRALALNPNLAVAWFYSGCARKWLGEPDLAIEHLQRAMRLSPLDPSNGWAGGVKAAIAHAHFHADRYDEASSWAAMALREWPDSFSALHIATASNALAGRLEETQKLLARLMQIDPALRISSLRNTLGPYRRPRDVARYEEGLRRAGVPE